MFCMDESILTLEEVERALNEIENKYNAPVKVSQKGSIDDLLAVLSKEFDTLGLPTIDLEQSLLPKFLQVVTISIMLVQLHRRTISQIRDVNIDCKVKDTKSNELKKKIEDLQQKIVKSEDKNANFRSQALRQSDEHSKLITKADLLKEELDRTKRYHASKLNELKHNIRKLSYENQKMKEKFGQDIGTHYSKDDITVELLKKHKRNEEIYKSTIKKLQENNHELLQEISNLKEELSVP